MFIKFRSGFGMAMPLLEFVWKECSIDPAGAGGGSSAPESAVDAASHGATIPRNGSRPSEKGSANYFADAGRIDLLFPGGNLVRTAGERHRKFSDVAILSSAGADS
ncbi:hypothetical protein LP417_21880 [Polaromonas sp. P1-6]|nr:hypothetical protein LP417_21880 [Polaromonas sp. P1-6]